MKSILISIKPKWCAKIMNGDKTIEVRTSKALASAIQKLIDEYGYAEFYVYCSKDKEKLVFARLPSGKKSFYCPKYNNKDNLNGKIVFNFRCYYVKEYPYIEPYLRNRYNELSGSCLSEKEILDYSTIKEENGIRYVKTIYAIPISNLKIFDIPKELSEFKRYGGLEYAMKNADNPLVDDNWNEIVYLTKAPQNFCYIEVEG